MADALEDWEQAGEDEILVPIVVAKAVKKTIPTPTPTRILSKPTSTAPVTSNVGPGGPTPMLLRRNHDRTPDLGQDDFMGGGGDRNRNAGNKTEDGRALHERNRAIWDRANAYEQPIISRSDNTSMRTEYVPEIKILRRPKSPVQMVKVQHAKSKPLAQREADYNAAREKIFGPSSTQSSSSSTPSTNTSGNTNSSNSMNHHNNNTNKSSNSRSSPVQRSGSSTPSPRSSSPAGPQDIKPIDFKGVPPSIRQSQRGPPGGAGQDLGNTAIRQPQGPSSTLQPQQQQQQQHQPSNGRGAGTARREGESVGFRRPFRGSGAFQPRPSPPPAPSS